MIYKIDDSEINCRYRRESLKKLGFSILLLGMVGYHISFLDVNTLLGKIFIIPILIVGYFLSRKIGVKKIDENLLLFESRRDKHHFGIEYDSITKGFTYYLYDECKTKQELAVEISMMILVDLEDSLELIIFYEKECKRNGITE